MRRENSNSNSPNRGKQVMPLIYKAFNNCYYAWGHFEMFGLQK